MKYKIPVHDHENNITRYYLIDAGTPNAAKIAIRKFLGAENVSEVWYDYSRKYWLSDRSQWAEYVDDKVILIAESDEYNTIHLSESSIEE